MFVAPSEAAATTTWLVKMRSPATVSGATPLSSSARSAAPPTAVASAVTLRVRLGGLAPGATCAAITSVCPGSTGLGVPEAAVIAGGLGAVSSSTTKSSMPTHSSLPAASAVMIRSCTIGWLSTAAGNVTSTGVTTVARLGPVVASAT